VAGQEQILTDVIYIERNGGWMFKGMTDKGKHEMCVMLGVPAGLQAEVFLEAKNLGATVERMTGMGLKVEVHGAKPKERPRIDLSKYMEI
jgi:hypothetical protein